ncbi:MAG TPA: efflux RND transporter periplasmic adaptor subunit [Kofleriaceae bacterium]|nr:efflux RND transporter periplasmic adaptor subunit [Kofleriaceae bacterium]
MTQRIETTRSRLLTGGLFLLLSLGFALGIGLAGSLLTGCSGVSEANTGDAQPAAPRVSTAAVAMRQIADTAVATGTVVADRSSSVAADAAGKVIAVYVERGQRVKQGQPLVRLDVRGAVLGAREARAQRAAADSEARLADAECARSRSLFDKAAITRAQFDREMAACTGTREQVAAASARVSMANKAVGDGLVRAPYDGVVVERMVQVGEYVRADSQLVSLVDPDPLRLELTVPESLIGRLAVGRSLSFTTTALPGRSFTARIDILGPAVDRAGRSLVVEALVEAHGVTPRDTVSGSGGDGRGGEGDTGSRDGGAGLLPGMFVTANIQVGSRELPVLPRAALRRVGSTWRIFAVVDGALEERIVQLASGAPESGQVALLIGARAGDRVVSPASAELRDGMRIN